MPNGEYDGTLGTCKATCLENQLKPFSNGNWACVGADSLRCGIKCYAGFEAANNVQATCIGGRWSSHPEPTCSKVQRAGCLPLPNPANGKISCSNPQFRSGTTCLLLCDDGFSLTGTAVSVCSTFGSWNTVLGTCSGRGGAYAGFDKLPPTSLDNGGGNAGGSVSNGDLDENGCLTPRLGVGASLSCKSHSGSPVGVGRTVHPGSNCELACAKGFYSEGVKMAYCGPTGAWASSIGSCRPICSTLQLDHVENADWTCKGVAVLTCTLKCKPGYEGEAGPASCDGGAWVKPINPECRHSTGSSTSAQLPETPIHRSFPFPFPVAPKKPVVPEVYCYLSSRPNGNFQCPKEENNRVPLGGNCFLKCKDSFKTKTKCTKDGSWIPRLHSLSCPDFTLYTAKPLSTCTKPAIQHGSLDCAGSEIPAKGVCKLTCNYGYKPTWATQATCQDEGYWDNYLACV